MPITLVPDPTWKGKPPREAPLMVASEAMRKLYKAGSSIQEIAEYFGSSYGRVWKAVNPPRKVAGEPGSTRRKPLTDARLATMTKGQVRHIAYMSPWIKNVDGSKRPNPAYILEDVQKATEYGDRTWGEGNWEE
jgi:hypothetical protein